MNNKSLRPLNEEEKAGNHNYRVGGLFTLSKNWASSYKPIYPSSWVMNQGEFEPDNDECGGVSSSRVMSILNGYEVGPHFAWMIAREYDGDTVSDYGISNTALAKSWQKVGGLRMEDEPFTFKDGRDVIQDPTKYPPLQPLKIKAAEQAIGSYIWVKPDQGFDSFDVFRSTITILNKKYGKPHGAIFGLLWNWPMSQYQIDAPSDTGSGHDVAVIGWDGDYAIIIQSYGKEAGVQGEQKLHRSVINKWAESFGMFIPIDASREQIDALIASGGKFNDPWRVNIVRRFVDTYKSLKKPFSWLVAVLEMFLNNSKVGGVMLWDTPAHCRRNVRVMCDEAGLSFGTKNVICAIIKQESNWNVNAKNTHNENGTTDHSLLQINDHVGYHIGQGLYFSSVEDVYAHPEKQVRFIIQMAKAGKLNLWSSFKFGQYRRYLVSESVPSIPY